MKIVIECASALEAKKLKAQIVNDVKKEELKTWEHTTGSISNKSVDIIFHNPSQYVEAPEKNVIFIIDTENNEVVFSTNHWSKKPHPSREMNALHTGRLVEAILRQGYSGSFQIID